MNNGRSMIERLVRSIALGIRTMNPIFGEVKVPNPTADMLVFHKAQKGNSYVTLQAQTSLINGIISEKEVDWICQKVAELSELNEMCCSYLITFVSCMIITSAILFIFIPLVLGANFKANGYIGGFVFYFSCIFFFCCLKRIM